MFLSKKSTGCSIVPLLGRRENGIGDDSPTLVEILDDDATTVFNFQERNSMVGIFFAIIFIIVSLLRLF